MSSAHAQSFGRRFLDELVAVAARLNLAEIDRLAERLSEIRSGGGRVFVIGLGGSAANASHAACDLRGLAGLDACAPTDNVASFTAAANDHGWRDAFNYWLKVSRICDRDALLVLSVGGGSLDPPVSECLIAAIGVARAAGAFVCGVVGPDGGETMTLADLCIRVPVEDRALRTTHTEIFQSVIWHMLVTHPALNSAAPRWESLCP
jgi:D-sedoheptulose 7-phosphate isomerase